MEWGEGRACREMPQCPHFFFPPHEEKLSVLPLFYLCPWVDPKIW
jgi:hypothetical protein